MSGRYFKRNKAVWRYAVSGLSLIHIFTFIIMFLAAFLTGSLAIRIKNQAKQAAQSAYRTKVLFDTNQLLQQAKDKNEIVSATSNQLIKLLRKDIVFYLADGEVLDLSLIHIW